MLSRTSHRAWEQNPAAPAGVKTSPDALYKAEKVPYYRKWHLRKKRPHESHAQLSDHEKSQLESGFLNSMTVIPSEGQITRSRFPGGPGRGTVHNESTVTPCESIPSVNKINQAIKPAQKAPSREWKLQLLNWTLTFERQHRKKLNGNTIHDTKTNVSRSLKMYSIDHKYDSGICYHALKPNHPRTDLSELPDWSKDSPRYDQTNHGQRCDQSACVELDAHSPWMKPVLNGPNQLNTSFELPQNRFSALSGSAVEPPRSIPVSSSTRNNRIDLSSAEGYVGSGIDRTSPDQLKQTKNSATVDQSNHPNSTDTKHGPTNGDVEHIACYSGPSGKEALQCGKTYSQVESTPLLDRRSMWLSLLKNHQTSLKLTADPDTSSSPAPHVLHQNSSLTKLSVIVPVSSNVDHGALTSSSIASSSPANISPMSHTVSSAPTSTSVSPVHSSPSATEFFLDEDEDFMQQIEDAICKGLLPKILETFSGISKAQHEARIQELFRRGTSNQHTNTTGSHAAGNGTGGNPETGGLTSFGSSSNTDPRGNKKENKTPMRDDEEDAEESDEEDPKRPASMQSPAVVRKKYACPFHKLNPSKFRPTAKDMRFKTCTRGFACPKHLKAHLKRIHSPPVYCDRCSMVFNSQKEKIKHAKQTSVCKPYDDPEFKQIYIMQPEQREQIFKKKSRRMTHEQYRYNIWRLLFPDAEFPSSIHPDYTDFKMILQMALDECIPKFVKGHVDPDVEGDRLREIVHLVNDRVMDLLDNDHPQELFPSASGQVGLAVYSEDETGRSVSAEGVAADPHQSTLEAEPALMDGSQRLNLDESAPRLNVQIEHDDNFNIGDFIIGFDDSDGRTDFALDLPSLPPKDPVVSNW